MSSVKNTDDPQAKKKKLSDIVPAGKAIVY